MTITTEEIKSTWLVHECDGSLTLSGVEAINLFDYGIQINPRCSIIEKDFNYPSERTTQMAIGEKDIPYGFSFPKASEIFKKNLDLMYVTQHQLINFMTQAKSDFLTRSFQAHHFFILKIGGEMCVGDVRIDGVQNRKKLSLEIFSFEYPFSASTNGSIFYPGA